MKEYLKSIIIICFCLLSLKLNCSASILDESVNDEIRRNYKDTKLIDDTELNSALHKSIKYTKNDSTDELPALPNITKQTTKKYINTSKTFIKQNSNSSAKTLQNIKINKNTSIDVINSSAISDKLYKGSTVQFTTKNISTNKKTNIPNEVIFYGEITDIHPPQITCNGGLVSIQIKSMQYCGNIIPVTAYVTKANAKHIFFNDIKGQRTFLKTLWKKGNWGRTLFNQMLKLTVNLGAETSTLILAPFPFVYGSICLGLNTLTSPITAFFSKGGHVSFPAGTMFKIKFTEDVQF